MSVLNKETIIINNNIAYKVCKHQTTFNSLNQILKALGHKSQRELFEILDIYRKGQRLTDFTKSVIILIEKKQGAKECGFPSWLSARTSTLSMLAEANTYLQR